MVDYKIEPPYEALDKDHPWYTAKVGARTWDVLKAKLTGGTDSGGTGYSSTVNLSDADADKLIENMKKDPRGYPQFNDGGGGMNFYENYEKYQAWLVKSYLGKPVEEEEEDIPEGLDDLLGSIQDEPAEETPEPKVTTIKAGAIVPSKFFGEDKYAKYRDELIADGTIEGEQLTTEERKEGFKTRNDSDKFSRFVENFLNRKKESDNQEVSSLGASGALVVPTQQKINVDPLEEENESNFDDILKGIDSILDIIKRDQKFDEIQANKERRKEEREKRTVSENKLEKKDSLLVKTAKKVLAPVKSIFDKIIEFFTTIFLGRALMKLLDWFGDEENGKKIESIIKFLGDWWPTILAGFLLFGTGLGGLISSTAGLLAKFTPKILKLLANPIVAGTVLAGAGIFAAGKMLGKDKVVENETVRADTTRKALEQAPSTKDKSPGEREALVQGTRLKDAGGGGSLNAMPNEFVDPLGLRQDPSGMGSMQAFSGGGMVEKKEKKSFNIFNPMSWFSGDAQKATKGELDEVSNDSLAGRLYNRRKQQEEMMKKLRGYEEGGRVRGESGIDKVPAMLTNGEFVMSAGAVQKYGLDTMMSMNAAGGGTNKPKIMEGMMYANGGGSSDGQIDFDPVSYRKGMLHSHHIDNPGGTGETYVLGYTRTPDGDVNVKQMNRVVQKAGLLSMFGASDQLTGVSPDSDKWNLVLNSANTQKELSTFSGTGRNKKKVAPKSIKTDPKAKIAFAYNDSFQTHKNDWQKKGKTAKQANRYAAAAAQVGAKLTEDGSALPNSDKGYEELNNVSVKKGGGGAQEKNRPRTPTEILTDALSGMLGFSMKSDKDSPAKAESNAEYGKANLQGAKLGEGYGSEGKKIAGDLGTFMKQRKTSLPVTGSIHRHPKHPPWSAGSGHSSDSYHYSGRALDIGGWAPSHPSSGGNDEQAPVLRALLEFNKKNEVEPVELIHGSPSYKNYGSYREHPDSHANHVHAAYNKGGTVIKKPAKLTVPELAPIQKQKPKVSVVDGGTKSNAPSRQSTSTKIPAFNASTASREKANLLGIIDY